jgi:RNA polymerase sigma-70 factor (ECF subfamily)
MDDENMIHISMLYDEYATRVYNLSLHYVRNIPDAEEITQDVFLKIHNSLSDFNQEAEIGTWIHRITVNTALDHLRKQNAKKRRFILSMDNAVLPASTNHVHPGIQLEEKESIKALMDIINELPNNQKTAIILHKIEGLSQRETALIMKRSVKSVESLIGRARIIIKEKLGDK